MAVYTKENLDSFIAQTDDLGGPGASAASEFWSGFQYIPSTPVDQTLDPYSAEYFQQQCDLYHELSQRTIEPEANELTAFDITEHVNAPNPYGSYDASNFVAHFLRLGFAIERAKLPPWPRVLDMGAGWGLSSEFLATLGARVTAVDINPAFVELIMRRQAVHKKSIRAIVGSFDNFEPNGRFDAIFFYECLHHAMKPWELISRARHWLDPGGKIVFVGEPVNDHWWRNWGLRLDPQSVYCIRKFGWFESGWSKSFIVDCFRRAQMSVDFAESSDPNIGAACVATKLSEDVIGPRMLANYMDFEGWAIADDYITSLGTGGVSVTRPEGVEFVNFDIWNFRPKPIKVSVSSADDVVYAEELPTGKSTIRCRLEKPVTHLRFISETFVPAIEVGNQDTREIGFCIAGATLS